jgi:N-acyl-D-aspartate/D-glutamate deacylase
MSEKEFDSIVEGGTVIDGTGTARRRADVGIRAGRVAEIGRLARRSSTERIDARGLVVAPGVVDAHTHYDPQITFEPTASMSSHHGVTTVLAGNCGFSVAPCRADDRDFIARLFAKVEQMHPDAMSGIRWDFESFPEFLAARDGKLGINFSCYLGHTNVRRWVMGEEASDREASESEVAAMSEIVSEAMRAGAAGISSSHAPTHLDGDDRPVPSRLSSREEFLSLARAAGAAGAGTIGYLPESAVGGLNEVDEDYLIEIGEVSGLPVIIQGLGGRNKVDAPTATWDRAVEFLNRASENGTPVYSMLIARPPDRPVVIDPSNFHYMAVPSWNEMLKLPKEERIARLRDPAAREEMRSAVENYNRDPARGTTTPPPMWTTVFVDNVKYERHEKYVGESIAVLAEKAGAAPADFMLDLALGEDLETEYRWRWETDEWRGAVRLAQQDPRMLVGTSDGGAHLARDDGSDWSSWFLRNWVLEREVWTLEEGIRQISAIPAALLGFADRGTLEVGKWADIMLFDPDRIGSGRKEFVHDFPGGAGRFKAYAVGVTATIVNGVPVVLEGEPTGARPGQVARPGRV